MDLYYKLSLAAISVYVLIGIFIQIDLDFDLMKQQVGFTEDVTKRKFIWYIMNGSLVLITSIGPWFI